MEKPLWTEVMSPEAQDTINGVVQDINKNKFTVFCGAGISRNSGLPSVWEFETEVMDKLPAREQEKQAIIKSDRPFERFMEFLIRGTP